MNQFRRVPFLCCGVSHVPLACSGAHRCRLALDEARLRGFAPSREAEKIGETDIDENAADYLEISPSYSCTP
ncbi:MAG: hypothetical protein WCP70_07530 [Methanothrix sp.]